MLTVTHALRRGLLLVALATSVTGSTAASAQSLDPPMTVAVGPAAVYVVQTDTATVLFGDGVTGQRPSTGALITTNYQSGAGAEGNIATSPGVVRLSERLLHCVRLLA